MNWILNEKNALVLFLKPFFEPLLEKTVVHKKIELFVFELLVQAVVCALAIAVFFPFKENAFFWMLAIVGGIVFPVLFWFFFLILKAEQVKKQKEDLAPDLLLSCSAFPKGTDSLTILRFCASAHFGLLGNEFSKALSEIQNGASVENALQNIKKRCQSPVIDRMIELLVAGYESGADLSAVFREVAEDLYQTKALFSERQAALLVEKVTVLVAGGLIVPVVLGLVWSMMNRFDFSTLSVLEIGLDAASRKTLWSAALLGTQAYLIEYALLASVFVAIQEAQHSKAILYAAILVPVGWIAFWLAHG